VNARPPEDDGRRRPSLPAVALVTFGDLGRVESGGAVRAAHTAASLARLGALRAVLCVGGTGTDPPGWLPAGPSPLGVRPVNGPGRWGWLAALAAEARRVAPLVDAFVVESAMLGPSVLAGRRPVAWDTNECETLHYRRLPRTWEVRAKGAVWLGLESFMGRTARVVVAISAEEAAHWRALFPATRTKLAVCDHLPWLDPAVAAVPSSPAPGGALAPGRYVLFVGPLGAKHNRDAARWCATALRGALPASVTVVLAGAGTDELVAALGAPVGVVGAGHVADLDALVAHAELCVAPLAAGAGVKTKVVHALALGQRVAGTPVAFEGLGDAPGCVVAPLDRLAAAVAGLVARPEATEATLGRRRAQADWTSSLLDPDRLDRQWAGVLARLG